MLAPVVHLPVCGFRLQAPVQSSILLTRCAVCLQSVPPRGGDGGGVFVDAYTDYEADHTIFDSNVARRGGGVFLADRAESGSTVIGQATFFASHSLFLKNVRACCVVCMTHTCVCQDALAAPAHARCDAQSLGMRCLALSCAMACAGGDGVWQRYLRGRKREGDGGVDGL
jgi:hypothetical protein